MTQFRLLVPLVVVLAMVVAGLLMAPRTSSAPEAPASLPMQPLSVYSTPTCLQSAYVPGDLIGDADPASINAAVGCP